MPSPNRSPWRDNVLTSVAALSPTDVWAVGFFGARTSAVEKYRTLILHWDGSRWALVHRPNGHNYTTLGDIAAVDADDVWAVGCITRKEGQYRGFFEHWDGTSWSIVDSTTPRRRTGCVFAVSAVSHDDVWATTGTDAFLGTSTRSTASACFRLRMDGRSTTPTPARPATSALIAALERRPLDRHGESARSTCRTGCAPYRRSARTTSGRRDGSAAAQPHHRDHRLHQRPGLDGLPHGEPEVLLHQPEAGVVHVAEEQRPRPDGEHQERIVGLRQVHRQLADDARGGQRCHGRRPGRQPDADGDQPAEEERRQAGVLGPRRRSRWRPPSRRASA